MNAHLHSLSGKGILVLPHLRIQNANAISSPLTHGFPAMTAFLGLMWALERKLAAAEVPLWLEKVGVVCHWWEEQVQDGYVKTFRLTRNPVGKDGSTAAIVEEGRIHLDITLVFQVDGGEPEAEGNVLFASAERRRDVAWQVRELLGAMRVAGGSVLPPKPQPGQFITPQLEALDGSAEDRAKQLRRLRRRWLPGFTLVGRDELLQRRLKQLQAHDEGATALDAWLDLSRFNLHSAQDQNGKVSWQNDRPADAGWLVPMPVGYAALSDLYAGGQVANARDEATAFRFVESVYSLGEWIGPHRINRLDDLLWWGEHDAQTGLYRCLSGYTAAETEHVGDAPEARPSADSAHTAVTS